MSNQPLTEFGYSAGYQRQEANLDVHKLLSYFPKWSLSNKSYLSNAAKIFSPVNDGIENIYFDSEAIVYNNIAIAPDFETPSSCYRSVYTDLKQSHTTTVANIVNTGSVKISSLMNAPITKVLASEDVNGLEVYEFEYDPNEYGVARPLKVLNLDCVLYIKQAQDFTETEYPFIVEVSGHTVAGDYITESITIASPHVYATHNRFKIITAINSTYRLTVSNRLNLSDSHSYTNYGRVKRAASISGGLFEPIIDKTENSLSVNGFTDSSVIDIFRFNSVDMSHLYVSNYMDVIGYANSKLYVGKLHLPVELNLNINSSYNNNQFVYVDSETSIIGESVQFTINLDNIKEIFGDNYIQILVERGSDKTYITDEVYGVADSNTWINQSVKKSSIVFTVPLEDNTPILVRLYVAHLEEYFCAGTILPQVHYKIFNTNDLTGIDEDYEPLLLLNNKLMLLDRVETGVCSPVDYYPVYKELSIIRDGFTYDDVYIYTLTDFVITG